MPKTDWSPMEGESLTEVRRKIRSYVFVILLGTLCWAGVIVVFLYLTGK